jgi:hypothetical protein
MKLLDMIRSANQSKNKQAHRVAGDTKRGRQLLAATKNPQDVIVPTRENGQSRDGRGNIKRTIGKRDI